WLRSAISHKQERGTDIAKRFQKLEALFLQGLKTQLSLDPFHGNSRDLPHHFLRQVIAQFPNRGKIITKFAQAKQRSKSQENRTGKRDRHISDHPTKRHRRRRGLQDAKILLRDALAYINRLDERQHLLISRL